LGSPFEVYSIASAGQSFFLPISIYEKGHGMGSDSAEKRPAFIAASLFVVCKIEFSALIWIGAVSI
jgi:hypothetical protein